MVAKMALDFEIARLSRILVDTLGISFEDAQAKLRALKLEVVVGSDATSTAAHAAILTATSVGRRSFIGGVRVVGEVDQLANSVLPVPGQTLAEKCNLLGATLFEGAPTCRIGVGSFDLADEMPTFLPWWDGWNAGLRGAQPVAYGDGQNPLAGISAGALAVGAAFDLVRGGKMIIPADINLWGTEPAPHFREVFLPNAMWIVGLGNLGQAFLWALASLPYEDPRKVSLMLQDDERVNPENWATSVLVHNEVYGMLKTKVAERWAEARGFDTRRVDRRLKAHDRLDNGDPLLAISGLDKFEGRKGLSAVGFAAIVDAGLGRTANDFDKFAVRVFDQDRPIDRYFTGQIDAKTQDRPDGDAYDRLEAEIGRCGATEIGGASVAVPYVSAVAATTAVSRAIALASGCACLPAEVRRVSATSLRKPLAPVTFQTRGIGHAGRPQLVRSKFA
jgi:hypothetical protein